MGIIEKNEFVMLKSIIRADGRQNDLENADRSFAGAQDDK
jgi:hypothetical protein